MGRMMTRVITTRVIIEAHHGRPNVTWRCSRADWTRPVGVEWARSRAARSPRLSPVGSGIPYASVGDMSDAEDVDSDTGSGRSEIGGSEEEGDSLKNASGVAAGEAFSDIGEVVNGAVVATADGVFEDHQ
jgi:hypothetical protein